MLIVGVYVSLSFPASVFGGIINGFQRYDVNSLVGIGSSLVVARRMSFCCSRVSAWCTSYSHDDHHPDPDVRRCIAGTLIRSSRPSRSGLPVPVAACSRGARFSVYIAIIDWAGRLNYSADAIVIGVFMSSAAVAIWTVPQRIAEALQRLTNPIDGVLFPVVVDSDAGSKPALFTHCVPPRHPHFPFRR